MNGTVASVSGGTFSALIPLAEGANTLTATAANPAGTVGDTIQVTLDTTPPEVAISAPANGTFTTAAAITVSGTVSDASPIVQLRVNGEPLAPAAGSFSTSVPLAVGDNAIVVEAIDAAGHSGVAAITVLRGLPPPL